MCCQTPSNRLLDSCITAKEITKPRLDLHTNCWPSRNWSRWQLKETAFPRWPVWACNPFLAAASYYLPLFSLRETMLLSTFLNLLKNREPLWLLDISSETPNCSWCWRPLGLTLTIFILIPDVNADLTHKPMDITCKIKLLRSGVPMPCFNLSPLTITWAQLNTFSAISYMTLMSPSSFPYLNTTSGHLGDSDG